MLIRTITLLSTAIFTLSNIPYANAGPELIADLQGCGFDLLEVGQGHSPPSDCASQPSPQIAPLRAPGSNVRLVYGMKNSDEPNAATLPGVFEICLPLPIGVSLQNPSLYLTNHEGTTLLVGRDVLWSLDSSGADSSKQGDYCVSTGTPSVLSPGEKLWVAVEFTLADGDVVFGNASDIPGFVGTDCSLPGGNAGSCPVGSLPLLTIPIEDACPDNDSTGCVFSNGFEEKARISSE